MSTDRRYIAVVIIFLALFCVFFQIAHLQRAASEPLKESGNRMTSISLLARSFAQAHGGMWPPLENSPKSFRLPQSMEPQGYTLASRFTGKETLPVDAMLLGRINNAKAYILDPMNDDIAACIYLGFATTSESEVLSLVNAVKSGVPLDVDIPVAQGSGTLGSQRLYRLRNDLHQVMSADGVVAPGSAAPRIPVLIEIPRDGWAWVYFLDLHVERIPYPGPFPMTEAVVSALTGSVN